jgi:pseudaminic acid cytidylyltransferase
VNIAIIPARGGSKRIPRKNVRNFSGAPMISYAIAAARSSNLFDHVVVSTDDEEIARIAQECGAEAPFRRPENLADDYTPTVPVIAHAIEECEKIGWTIGDVCCVYPAVPFIAIEDLHEARRLLVETGADYSFPVSEFPSVIQRALKRRKTGLVSSFFPEFEFVRTQDVEPAYFDAGQFYWGTRKAWLSNPKIHSSGVGLVIPTFRVVDIDTTDDWKRAELMYMALRATVADEAEK